MMSRKQRRAEGGVNAVGLGIPHAQRMFDAGEDERVLDIARQVLHAEPDHVPMLELEVRALWRMGRTAQALQRLSRLMALNPMEPGYCYLQGMVLQAIGRYPEAIRSYERCASFETAPDAASARDAARALSAYLSATEGEEEMPKRALERRLSEELRARLGASPMRARGPVRPS